MSNPSNILSGIAAVMLVPTLASGQGKPLAKPTAEQYAVCNQHGFDSKVCVALIVEFEQHTLEDALKNNAVPPAFVVQSLDDVTSNIDSVRDALLPRARQMVIGSDLEQTLEPLAEAALQQVLTGVGVSQVGAQPSDGGATNLVSKPTTTDLISIASESGAFTDTTNGTSMTIQANTLGLAKLLTNRPVYHPIFRSSGSSSTSQVADFVQKLNFSVVLNVAQAGTTATATTGAANSSTPTLSSVLIPQNNASFSSFTASFTLHRTYSPQSAKFLKAWKDGFAAKSNSLQALSNSIGADIAQLTSDSFTEGIQASLAPQRTAWHTAGALAEIQGSAGFEAFLIAYVPYWNAALADLLPNTAAAKAVLKLDQDTTAYNQVTYGLLDDARGTLANIAYTYADDGQKPATHNLTGSVGYVFKGTVDKATGKGSFRSGLQLNANVTASIYASLPAGAAYGRLRAFQGSAEIDKPLGGTTDNPHAMLSLAGYGQYQFDPTVLNISAGNLAPGTSITLPSDAQVLLGTSGWLGIVQGKFVINLAKGLSLPVAIKWSNKTDLLQANDVRGQFGLSYDLSALKSVLGGGTR